MSGRWRSRHWQSGDDPGGRPHPPPPPPRDGRDRSREAIRERWGDAGDDGDSAHGGDGARDGHHSSGRGHRPREPDPPRPHNDNLPRSSWSGHSDDGGGEWRRGQRLPSREGGPPRDRSRGRDDRRTQREQSSHGRHGSGGRAAFPAAPAKAWGGKPSGPVQSSDASMGDRPEPRGWGRPDANAANAGEGTGQGGAWPTPTSSLQKAASANQAAASAPTGSAKREDNNRGSAVPANDPNPWAQPGAGGATSLAADDAMFPLFNAKGGEGKPATTPAGGPSSLPSTSSWGKGQTLAQPSGPAKPRSDQKGHKGEHFPSLSTSLTAPRHQSTSSRTTVPSTKATPPMDDRGKQAKGKAKGTAKGTAKGPSHKSAAPAKLASFLAPQLAGGTAAGGKGGKKKPQAKQGAASKNAPVRKVNMDHRPTGPGMHPALANVAGTKRGAPGGASSILPPSGGGGELFVGQGGPLKKGRQRLVPRKKKLSTLKKRVLKERLRVWREHNGIVDGAEAEGTGSVEQGSKKRARTEGGVGQGAEPASGAGRSTTLVVENYVRPAEDDLADEDEYEEIVSNLLGLAGRVGRVSSVFVPRPPTGGEGSAGDDSAVDLEARHVGLAFVRFGTSHDMAAARDILEGMVVGGQKLRASVVASDGLVRLNDNASAEALAAPSEEEERQWRTTLLKVVGDRPSAMDEDTDVQTEGNETNARLGEPSSVTTVAFHDILCEDDYDDDEALQESIEDVRGLAQQYGPVVDARASTSGNDRGNVYIVFENRTAAERAVQQLDGIVVGGSKIRVSTDSQREGQPSGAGELVLSNVLNDDDFEDEDCLNESLEDIRNLARKYGTIASMHAETSGDEKGKVRVLYADGHQVAQRAAQELNGRVVGGVTISASVTSMTANSESPVVSKEIEQTTNEVAKSEEPPPPMYSGDKIVPERFAACKRVPKIPNPGTPRSYATKIPDERAAPLVIEILGELMRLQERSKDDKNARARRRLVMGLREVARGIRAHKVKMVVMANNLDQYGAIDAKLQEILDLARAEGLPVVFELNKRKLGKALGKSIKVSVVGVQSSDGADQQLKKLKKIMGVV